MDLSYGPEYEAFRDEIRTFVAEHGHKVPRSAAGVAAGRPGPAVIEWQKILIEHGYAARTIPKEYGGFGAEPDILKRIIIEEELNAAGVSRGVAGQGPEMLVPTLLEHGTEEQKRRYIEPTMTEEIKWCQGFSEPGAGSDLASLQTKAELVGDEWVINGQKIWTSEAPQSDMIFMLCRTEPDAPKHAGISYLMVDMRQPGVEVRPLKQMNGDTEFSEVFFDDARTPADHLVGRRGEGWVVSRSTLKHERTTVGSGPQGSVREFESLLRLVKEVVLDGRPALEDPKVRQRLIEIEGYVRSHEYSGYRQLTCDARGEDPGPVATMNKLVGSNIFKMIAELGYDLIDDYGLRAPGAGRGSPRPDRRVNWVGGRINAIARTIGGGTSNTHRNAIGERGLGLPRDFAARKSFES